MEHYTRLDYKEIEAVLSQFNISDISSYELLSGGSENTNYLVKTGDEKYVLSICEQKTLEQTKHLADLLVHLGKNHFNTSKIVVTTDKESAISWKGKPIMVKEYLEGKIVEDLSPDSLNLIGNKLGKLHKIDAPDYLPRQLGYGKEHFEKAKLNAGDTEFNDWLDMVLAYISPYFDLDLPRSFIHGDVYWDNVILSADESSATIMDFEEAAYYYRVFDIGMTIIGICAEQNIINFEKAKYFLAGYQSEIQLSADEIKSLKAFTIYAGTSMTFWRHQNFNYVKPDHKMFDHYLGLKVLVDFMVAQEDHCLSGLIS